VKLFLLISGALLALLPDASAARAAARPKPRITAAQARQVALRKFPHARADAKVPLENEEGKWEYAVNVHQRTRKGVVTHEVMVGAMSGKIESEEVTTPAEEAREKAAEQKTTPSRRHTSK
jgi:Peptidase propeptide and YPEB domain